LPDLEKGPPPRINDLAAKWKKLDLILVDMPSRERGGLVPITVTLLTPTIEHPDYLSW
jgi:hypothetical protein